MGVVAPTATGARGSARVSAFGRGRTPEEAEAGCIGEALESYSAVYRGTEPLRTAAIGDVPAAIDPRRLLGFSARQYAERHARNAVLPSRHAVPDPFDREAPIAWLRGCDLSTGDDVWLPAACCLTRYPCRSPGASFAHADMTGCGSGPTMTAAMLHALLECVERDATSLWWYNRCRRPAVRPETLGDSQVMALVDAFARDGQDLVMLDVTTDVAIPTYVALSTIEGGSPVFGAAAHLVPGVAAWKAASEAALNRLCARHVLLPPDIARWVEATRVDAHPFLQPYGEVAAPAAPGEMSDARQLDVCVDRVRARGLQPVCVDLSRPDVAWPAARVLVPGLRHVLDRRGPGRLYDVPVALGWRDAGSTEDDLNPLPCTW